MRDEAAAERKQRERRSMTSASAIRAERRRMRQRENRNENARATPRGASPVCRPLQVKMAHKCYRARGARNDDETHNAGGGATGTAPTEKPALSSSRA